MRSCDKTRSLLAKQNAQGVFQNFSQTFSSRSGLPIVLFRTSGSPRTITISSSRVRRLQIEIKNNSKSAWNKHVAATFQQYTKAAVTMNHTDQEIPAWKLTRKLLKSATLKKYIRCQNHDRQIHGQCQCNRPYKRACTEREESSVRLNPLAHIKKGRKARKPNKDFPKTFQIRSRSFPWSRCRKQ